MGTRHGYNGLLSLEGERIKPKDDNYSFACLSMSYIHYTRIPVVDDKKKNPTTIVQFYTIRNNYISYIIYL